jgi:hypothetical protein
MTRITVSSDMRNCLGDLQRPVELYDESGRLIGRVIPAYDPDKYDLTEPDIDPEEIQRRLNERPRYSTKEVLEHLENL